MVAKNGPIISRDPEVVSGELVFAGTRVPVKNLVDYFVAGHYSLDDFLDDFPSVGREQAAAYLEMSMEAADELRVREREASPDARTAR
ncbi:hypothetical protein BH24ACT19_BH24ACT19_20110 [soil metagenome]